MQYFLGADAVVRDCRISHEVTFSIVRPLWAAIMSISALTVLQCFLRERTGNLWECIICHLVSNATAIFASSLRHA